MLGEVDVDHFRSECGDFIQVMLYIEPDEQMPVRLQVCDSEGESAIAYLSTSDAGRIADALSLASRMADATRPLQVEIDRLRAVLQFYADQHMYEIGDGLVPVNIDCGDRARSALDGQYQGAEECEVCV